MVSLPKESHTVHHQAHKGTQPKPSASHVTVVFNCNHGVMHSTRVPLTRHTTLDELEDLAQSLYASSLPAKLRGARVIITVNGYSLQGPLTVGEIHDTLRPKDGTLHVLCNYIMPVAKTPDD
jgi:hypothetical protein